MYLCELVCMYTCLCVCVCVCMCMHECMCNGGEAKSCPVYVDACVCVMWSWGGEILSQCICRLTKCHVCSGVLYIEMCYMRPSISRCVLTCWDVAYRMKLFPWEHFVLKKQTHKQTKKKLKKGKLKADLFHCFLQVYLKQLCQPFCVCVCVCVEGEGGVCLMSCYVYIFMWLIHMDVSYDFWGVVF